MQAAAAGRLRDGEPDMGARESAVCVVMASGGYPRSYPKDIPVQGLDVVEELEDVKVFHAGTRLQDGTWLTAGGRVIGVTARGPSIARARERAYDATGRIRFKGAHYRSDIAARPARAEA